MKVLLIALLIILSFTACKKENPLVEVNQREEQAPVPPKVSSLQDPREAPQLAPTTPPLSNNQPLNPPGKPVNIEEFGIKEYPRALKENRNQSVTRDGVKNSLSLTFYTKDSPAKVAEFYADTIVSNRSKSVTASTAVVGGVNNKEAKIFVVASKIKQRTQVTVTATL